MSNISNPKDNLKYLKKLTNELCKKMHPNTNKQSAEKITNIMQILQKRNQNNSEQLLDEIIEILVHEND
tara:strand:- start:122 stop:328 length:207 start_codon:yes stop_codon:yes gene_type:complete